MEPVAAELQFSKATRVRLFLQWLPFCMLLIRFAPIGSLSPIPVAMHHCQEVSDVHPFQHIMFQSVQSL